MCAQSLQSCPTLCEPWAVARQAPLSMDSPVENTGSGLPSPLQRVLGPREGTCICCVSLPGTGRQLLHRYCHLGSPEIPHEWTHLRDRSRPTCRGWICGCQAGEWEREALGVWASRCKPSHVRLINKVLLDSTGSRTQYPVINHDGKEHEGECIW